MSTARAEGVLVVHHLAHRDVREPPGDRRERGGHRGRAPRSGAPSGRRRRGRRSSSPGRASRRTRPRTGRGGASACRGRSPTSPARGGRRRRPPSESLAPADPSGGRLSRSLAPSGGSGAIVAPPSTGSASGASHADQADRVVGEPGAHGRELIGALARAGDRDRFHVRLARPRERASHEGEPPVLAGDRPRAAPRRPATRPGATGAGPRRARGAGRGPRRPPRTAPRPRAAPSAPRALRGARPGTRGRRGDPGRALRSARGRSRPSHGAGHRPMSARAHGAKRVRAPIDRVQRRSGHDLLERLLREAGRRRRP